MSGVRLCPPDEIWPLTQAQAHGALESSLPLNSSALIFSLDAPHFHCPLLPQPPMACVQPHGRIGWSPPGWLSHWDDGHQIWRCAWVYWAPARWPKSLKKMLTDLPLLNIQEIFWCLFYGRIHLHHKEGKQTILPGISALKQNLRWLLLSVLKKLPSTASKKVIGSLPIMLYQCNNTILGNSG